MSNRFVIFLCAGGLAALVNLAARFLLSCVVPFGVAVALAYPIGMVVAFILFRIFVFKRSGLRGEAIRFCIINAVSFVQVWAVSLGLARVIFPVAGFVWHAEDIAHVIGVLSPVATSYYGHKHFSFADNRVLPLADSLR